MAKSQAKNSSELNKAEPTPEALAAQEAMGYRPDPGYKWPQDPATRAALEHWQDLKLGVIMHWGIYSYIGQGESWSLHREHLGDFTNPPATWQGSPSEYHTWYMDQARSFTGPEYDPTQWAKLCGEAGMKYFLFTTKHHDGFAMYDTQYSNFKSTSEDAGLGRDVFRQTLDAFRSEGLETGVYFSKADWSHPGYWDRSLPITNRFHNFDISAHPRKWDSFVQYTHAQIEELLTKYGPMNVLWLDGGWVCDPREPINIDEIARRARQLQPHILVVDREVHGINENYRTPEQGIPAHTLEYPWEACITMGKSWSSTTRDDTVKPTAAIIENLLKCVSRGGNYLIGIGPDATGHLSTHIRRGLQELGAWMEVNGQGIYATRAPRQEIVVDGPGRWYTTELPEARSGAPRQFIFGTFGAESTDRAHEAPAGSIRVKTSRSGARLLGGADLQSEVQGEDLILQIPAGPRWAVGIELI